MKRVTGKFLSLTLAVATVASLAVPSTAVSAFAAEGDETASAKVYMTISDQGVIAKDKDGAAMAWKEVTATDLDADGTVTFDEALVAAHETYCSAGKDGYAVSSSGWVTKLWGEEGSYSFIKNNVAEMDVVTGTKVEDYDYLVASVNQDNSLYSDWNSYFDKYETTVGTGDTVTLNLSGYQAMTVNEPQAAEGVQIGVWEDGAFTAIEGAVTDAEGNVNVSFETAGTYIVTASGTASDIVDAETLYVLMESAKDKDDKTVYGKMDWTTYESWVGYTEADYGDGPYPWNEIQWMPLFSEDETVETFDPDTFDAGYLLYSGNVLNDCPLIVPCCIVNVEQKLEITNNTGMFKAVTASLQTTKEGTNLRVALSGSGYHELFKGTYEQAVANGDNRDNWIHGYQNADGKWEFLIPLEEGESYIPIVAISNSYVQKYEQGQNVLARAFYPRQMEIDVNAKTLVTGDYEFEQDLTVNNYVKMFKVASAKLHTVGGPNSNNYKSNLELTMGSDAFDKVYVGTAEEAAAATDVIEIGDGRLFEIPMRWVETFGNPETMKSLIGEKVVMSFHSVKNDAWYEREVTVDEEAGTVLIDPAGETRIHFAGDEFGFYKEDAVSTFGMLSPQDGSKIVMDGNQVKIYLVPSNKTVYGAIHWGFITDEELTKDVLVLDSGCWTFAIDKENCEYGMPVAPVKKKDGKTTGSQYYLCIPAADQIKAIADYSAVETALAAVPEDTSSYTKESVEALTAAVAVTEAEDFGYYSADEQATVDAAAQAIEDAIAGLVVCDHDYKEEVTAPTCTEKGYTTYTCSHCGKSYVDNYVDALGHDYKEEVTAPTCTEKGYTTYTCTRCGDTYVDNYVDATGHTWDQGTVTTEATYLKEGVMTYTCTVCGETKTETIAKKTEKSKWVQEDGEWYYFNDKGVIQTNGWAKDSKGWCWMDADGKITKNKWIQDKGNWYYLKANGYMAAKEWAKDSKGWMYMDASGKITKNKWIQDKGNWYYLKANGYMAANEWAKDSKGWMYMDANGKITKNKWIKSNGYWYYLKSNGYMAANEYASDSTKTYWMGSDGRIAS